MQLHTIDLRYLGIAKAIAAYVIIGSDGPVLIETGPASTLDNLRIGLDAIGLQLNDVRHAVVTHIHLDHAGAAGHLAKNGTRIYVHEFGAKHLVDPSKLIESATRIYGAQMNYLWGTLLPVPAELVIPVHDGDTLTFGDVRLKALETPGHARHHHAFSIEGDELLCIAGDIAGISVPTILQPPEGRFISVPTPPPEFDPVAWHASIERLQQMNFDAIYLTHYGRCDHPHAHFQRLHELIDEHTVFVRSQLNMGTLREELLREYIAWNWQEAAAAGMNAQDFAAYVSKNLLTMNVDGILRYLSKTEGSLPVARS